MKTPIAFVFWLHNNYAEGGGIIAQLSLHVIRPICKEKKILYHNKTKSAQPAFEPSAVCHRNGNIMRQMLLQLSFI